MNLVKKQVRQYAGNCFMFELCMRIMDKKSSMICPASSKTELQEIVKPSVPKWNYGNFSVGPYHVPEEEVILWSLASLEAPLNDDGARRYQEIFTKLFPEEAKSIYG